MTESSPQIASLFLDFSREKMVDQLWPRLRGCVEALTEEQLWWRPNEASNSIGNLLLHLNGNVRQWLLTSFARAEDGRNRPAEFGRRDGISKSELIAALNQTLEEVSRLLSRLTPADLIAPFEIQGYRVTGLEAIYHVVEHFAMHYGQILYITKLLTASDLGFYRQLDQTGRA
jgi:uncharacterized damage-inducible protein DinB